MYKSLTIKEKTSMHCLALLFGDFNFITKSLQHIYFLSFYCCFTTIFKIEVHEKKLNLESEDFYLNSYFIHQYTPIPKKGCQPI